jgi:hypothetical protein
MRPEDAEYEMNPDFLTEERKFTAILANRRLLQYFRESAPFETDPTNAWFLFRTFKNSSDAWFKKLSVPTPFSAERLWRWRFDVSRDEYERLSVPNKLLAERFKDTPGALGTAFSTYLKDLAEREEQAEQRRREADKFLDDLPYPIPTNRCYVGIVWAGDHTKEDLFESLRGLMKKTFMPNSTTRADQRRVVYENIRLLEAAGATPDEIKDILKSDPLELKIEYPLKEEGAAK